MIKEEAIKYFEFKKKELKDFRKIYPSPNTVGYQATTKEISFYEMAISALSENKCFDGMTNGEVIRALYRHHIGVSCGSNGEYIHVWSIDGKCQMTIHADWWNAPYKAEKGGE